MTIKACIIIPAANDSVHDSTFRMNQTESRTTSDLSANDYLHLHLVI